LIIDDLGSSYQKIQPFKERVEQLPQIEQIALSSYLPTPSNRSDNTFYEEGHPEQEENVNMQEWTVSQEYISTMGMKLAAGRDFDRNMATDSSAMIINETTARLFGRSPEDAIGMRIVDPFGTTGNSQTYTVIGVVENFHFESLRQNISALSMRLSNYSDKMIVKVRAGDYERTISQIEETWASVAPGQPFNYYFMDDSFNSTYEAEQRLGQIFMIFTFLSILIACLGLFGLAAFNAEKRIKEIGVRKVMGASVGQIVYRLSSDFLKLVFIAILVSLPLGWYAMNKWLEDFQYRIEIPWWVYAVAALVAVAIALITVSYQAIKAAMVNPVKSLRSE
jgi:putative ABC transport system permease protein